VTLPEPIFALQTHKKPSHGSNGLATPNYLVFSISFLHAKTSDEKDTEIPVTSRATKATDHRKPPPIGSEEHASAPSAPGAS